MGLKEKLENAKGTSWLTDGISRDELEVIHKLASITAEIQKCRNSCKLTNEQFREIYRYTVEDELFGESI